METASASPCAWRDSSSRAQTDNTDAPGDQRYGERRAVLGRQQLVGACRIRPEEALVLRVHDERHAERERRLLEIDIVVVQMLDHAPVRLRELRIRLDPRRDLVGTSLGADLMRDVA